MDTSFAGSAMRTTGMCHCKIISRGLSGLSVFPEGVWMSLTPTNDALIVALDFEGASIKQIAHQGCIALSALLTPGAVLSLIWSDH